MGDQLAKIHKSWVPFEVTLYLTEDGTVHTTPEVEDKTVTESRTYHLYAVCCNVVDPVTPEASSLISCVKVRPLLLEFYRFAFFYFFNLQLRRVYFLKR